MPKVSKYGFRISTNDIAKYYEFDIMYSTDTFFYIDVPKDFLETFKLLSEDQLKECNSQTYLKKGHYGDENRSGKISGKTELEVKLNCDKLFKILQENSVNKSPVIIITFETDSDRHFHRGSSRQFNEEHTKQKLYFGLKYCTKVEMGGKVVYNDYYIETWSGKNEMVRSEISTDSDDIIIPDTPANRLFLEGIYGKLATLIGMLKDHLATPESTLALIESNQKLLL